ncbi:DUF853 family protein [Pendulispora brunnea]|uniref:DUF853 family protein n=1 Tax=Pendulispora brunnea TaxID=2905690 RepID=A0ABZ2KA55_9BACT
MSDSSLSLADVVTATRCPRQLVLAQQGHRVVPHSADTFGQAAHDTLQVIAANASKNKEVAALLEKGSPEPRAVEYALFRLGLGEAYAQAKKAASRVDGDDLARFSEAVHDIAHRLTPLVVEAGGNAAFAESENTVRIPLDGTTIEGGVDLLCRSGGQTWIWDLKTYTGTEQAKLEQMRLYGMAYAAQGGPARISLVHVVDERIQVDSVAPPQKDDKEKLQALARNMRIWLDGEPPPAARDQDTCRDCPAREACWRTWGRTLTDEVDEVRPITRPPPALDPEIDSKEPIPKDMEHDPLWIGMVPNKDPARLEPHELVRHVAVFGASGSGKTYLAKSIVEEAVLAGIPVLAFDVQGDILTLAKPLDDATIEPTLRARRDRYVERAEFRLLTPMSDAGLRISLNPLRFPSRDMPLEESTVYSEAVTENLLGHVRLPGGWRDNAAAYLAERIRHAMKKVDSLAIEDLINGIAEDEELDNPLLDDRQRARLVQALRLLTMGSRDLLFKLGRPFDLDALLKPSVPGKTPLNVLWLNGLGDQQNKESFVAMVLADVYGWMLRQRGGATPRVLLYFDEIGPYMPPHGEPPSKKLLKRIFKEGRKYGVCGLFCTQNFTDVDYKVVSQANTVAIGRLNAAQEKRKAIDTLGSPPNFNVSGAVDKLMNSATGRFIVRRLDQPPHWLQGRRLMTLHGPTWGEDEIRAHNTGNLE